VCKIGFNLCVVSRTEEDMEAWYPPGHGDFYQAFANSGLLEEFIGQVCIVRDIKETLERDGCFANSIMSRKLI
jgi:hypothetical protein